MKICRVSFDVSSELLDEYFIDTGNVWPNSDMYDRPYKTYELALITKEQRELWVNLCRLSNCDPYSNVTYLNTGLTLSTMLDDSEVWGVLNSLYIKLEVQKMADKQIEDNAKKWVLSNGSYHLQFLLQNNMEWRKCMLHEYCKQQFGDNYSIYEAYMFDTKPDSVSNSDIQNLVIVGSVLPAFRSSLVAYGPSENRVRIDDIVNGYCVMLSHFDIAAIDWSKVKWLI